MKQQAECKNFYKINLPAFVSSINAEKYVSIALLLLIAILFNGCKKNNNSINKPNQTCRIIKIIGSNAGASQVDLEYNSDGKLSKTTTGSTVLIFNYTGNQILIQTLDSGLFKSNTIVTLNAAGLAITVRREFDFAGTDWLNSEFTYNGEELTKEIFTSSNGSNPNVTNYTWFNGNLRTSGSNVYDYYTDKPSQQGEGFNLTQLLEGYETIRNKNILKSTSSSSSSASFSYDFDPDGKIVSFIRNLSGTILILDYRYECK